MPTYLDYSYDDRNGPAYPGVDDTAQAVAELQAQRNAQAADLARQDAMINVARGNVPYGTVYTNDGRIGAYRGYAINERGPYANLTGQFMPDPVSGALMYRSLRGFPSAQPHVVPGGPGTPFMYAAPISAAVSATMRDYPIFALNYNPKKAAAAGGGGGGAPAAEKPAAPAADAPAAEKPAEKAPAAAPAEPPVAPSTPGATRYTPEVHHTMDPVSPEDFTYGPDAQPISTLDINTPGRQEMRRRFNSLDKDLQQSVLSGQTTLDAAYNAQGQRLVQRTALGNGALQSVSSQNQTPPLQQYDVVVNANTPYSGVSNPVSQGYGRAQANLQNAVAQGLRR